MPLMSSPKKNASNSILTPVPTATGGDQPIRTLEVSTPAVELTSVNTTWTSKADLITHIEGSAWVVNYYSQILTRDSDLSGQQQSLSPTYQSYKKITDMEMKVTTPLSTSQVDETKAMVLEGTALLYPFIIPNEGDMFVANIGQGQNAVFRITNSIKKSIFKQACYEISYSLTSDDAQAIADLEEKAVEALYFKRNYLQYGRNPLLTQKSVAAIVELEVLYPQLFSLYARKFYSKEFATLMVPSQQFSVYDHYLCRFMFEMFGNGPHNELLRMKTLSSYGDDLLGYPSIWQALSELDPKLLVHGFTEAGLVATNAFELNPSLDSIRYSGFNYVVYPTNPHIFVDYQRYSARIKTIAQERLAVSPVVGTGELSLPEATYTAQGLSSDGFIYPVGSDAHYVLSEHFYRKDEHMSTLEQLVWDYLEGKPLDAQQLLNAAEASNRWMSLEQFYYWPLLLLLIQTTLNGQ